jgi:hypothetical protein
MGIWAIKKTKNSNRYWWLVIVSAACVICPVLLVLSQFAGYVGWQQVIGYWQSRFSDRSTAIEGGWAHMMMMLMINLATGFLPLLLVWMFSLGLKPVKKNRLQWPGWAFATIIFYNGVFFNWSALHQFAWMAFGLLCSVYFAVVFLPLLQPGVLRKLSLFSCTLGITIYFLVNPPGNKNLNGDRYDEQERTAIWISDHIPADMPIFIRGNTDKVIEYYSQRTFTTLPSLDDAGKTMHEFHLEKAVFLEFRGVKLSRITWLKTKEPG